MSDFAIGFFVACAIILVGYFLYYVISLLRQSDSFAKEEHDTLRSIYLSVERIEAELSTICEYCQLYVDDV